MIFRQEGGYIEVRKQGRCNRYRINRRKTLRHALQSHCTVGRLLALVAPAGNTEPSFTAAVEEKVDAPDAPVEEIVVEQCPRKRLSPYLNRSLNRSLNLNLNLNLIRSLNLNLNLNLIRSLNLNLNLIRSLNKVPTM